MRTLNLFETKSTVGAMASMRGSFSMGPGGVSYGNGFTITVTGDSANKLGGFHAYADRVIDASTNTVLFDGTQSAFCIKGASFAVQSVVGGHAYIYQGAC